MHQAAPAGAHADVCSGGHWVGYYASLFPEKVSHLVLFNTLYGGTDQHDRIGPGSELEDPGVPGRFRTAYGSCRLSTAESLFGARWRENGRR